MSLIISSQYQTKEWRIKQKWYKGGKYNECENFQKEILYSITNINMEKTDYRLNIYTYELEKIKKPFIKLDGFEWTENFDGIQYIGNNILLYNLKFVCDKGGAQTRTLRNVYEFINTQLHFLIKNITINNIIFINILDGNTSFEYMDKFKYLISKRIFMNVSKKIFVGDLSHFYESFYISPQ